MIQPEEIYGFEQIPSKMLLVPSIHQELEMIVVHTEA